MTASSWLRVKRKNDRIVLKKLLNVCNFMGVLPFNRTEKDKLKSYIQQILWFIFHFVGMYFRTVYILNIFHQLNISTMGYILIISVFLTHFIYLFICMHGIIRYQKCIKKFLENLHEIDNALGEEMTDDTTTSKIYLNLTIYHLMPLLAWGSELLDYVPAMENQFQEFIVCTYSMVFRYLMFLPILAISHLERILTVRYQHFNIHMRKTIFHHTSVKYSNSGSSTKKLRKVHFLLTDTIKRIDEIFGFPILIILMEGYLTFLNTFNNIVISVQNDVGKSYLAVIRSFLSSTVSMT